MDAAREDDWVEKQREEASVALLVVNECAVAEAKGDEVEQMVDGAEVEDEEVPDAPATQQERKTESDSESYSPSDGSKRSEPPPPPLVLLHESLRPESHDQRHSRMHPFPERKEEIDDIDRPPVVLTDEWASTRRSGKRSQQPHHASSMLASVDSTSVKVEDRLGGRYAPSRHDMEEDKLYHYVGDSLEEELVTEMGIRAGTDADVRAEAQSSVAAQDTSVHEPLESNVSSDDLAESRRFTAATKRDTESSISDTLTESNDKVTDQVAPGYSNDQGNSGDDETPVPARSPPTVAESSTSDEKLELSETSTAAISTRSSDAEEPEWLAALSDSGHTYYYNRITEECRWEHPQRPEPNQEAFEIVTQPDQVKWLESLLRNGVDPDATNADGATLLGMAVQAGNDHAVDLLVAYGAAPDLPTTYGTSSPPLLSACQHGNARIIEALLKCGVSSDVVDASDNSVLHLLARSRSNDALHVVLVATRDKLVNRQNAEGETALHIATKLNNVEAVQDLLTFGANPQLEDALGQSPLVAGILENSVECVQLLQTIQPSLGALSDGKSEQTLQLQAGGSYGLAEDSDNDVDKLLASIVPTPESCDHEVLEALQSFADETQHAISTLEDQLQEKKRNEKNYHVQIHSLTVNLQAANDELEKEKQLRLQVEANAASKASEHEALRAAFVATMTRCTLLESVARDAHAKLKMERSERARSEDAMHSRLQQSLDENASLLQALYALQAVQAPVPTETRLFIDRSRENTRASGSKRKPSVPARYVQYPEAGNLSNEYDQTSHSAANLSRIDQQDQYGRQPRRHVVFAKSSGHDKREEVRSGSVAGNDSGQPNPDTQETGHTSTSRVGAVWNRFYENLGQMGAVGAQASPRVTATLFDAIRRSDIQCLQTLLLSGSSPNQRDASEKGTPLHLACELGDLDAVVLLCDFSADVEAQDEEANTPLLAACAQGNYECVKFLLESAVSLDAANSSGESALHLAAWDGSAECVAILIEYGVDTSATNAFGLTALGNLKTRSPLRHKLDDMSPDHPIRRTIRILEDHEAEHQMEERVEQRSLDREAAVAPLASPPPAPQPQAPRTSTWREWLFGSVKAPAHDALATDSGDSSSDVGEEEQRSSGGDGDDLSSYSDAELDASALPTAVYSPLTPPPEVAEALDRARRR